MTYNLELHIHVFYTMCKEEVINFHHLWYICIMKACYVDEIRAIFINLSILE